MVDITVTHQPDDRGAAKKLASRLKNDGFSASTVERTKVRGAVSGTAVVEMVGIFIGTGVASTVINAIATDIYNSAKKWAAERLGKRHFLDSRPHVCTFTIYDSSGNKLLSWTGDDSGHERDD